jgi:hypothetical protein
MGELLPVGTVNKAYRAVDNYAAVRLHRWLRIKHKVGRQTGGGLVHSRIFTGRRVGELFCSDSGRTKAQDNEDRNAIPKRAIFNSI